MVFFIFYFKDQLDFPKLGRIMFLIRWYNLTGFSCIRESFIHTEKSKLEKWVTSRVDIKKWDKYQKIVKIGGKLF
jgi:hypothetical protein